MKKATFPFKQAGFSLVELVITMVIIAILAAVVIPRYINLSDSSQQNATNSVAAALGAASATNYAKRTANTAQGSAVANCTAVGPLITGGLPTGYTITSLAITAGSTATCTVTGPGSKTATFIGMGIA